MSEDRIKVAMKLRERDARARILADSCVAAAMQELSDVAPDNCGCRSFAHRVAGLATALLVSGIYLGDEEVRALKEENDRLKERLFDQLRTTAPSITIAAITGVPDHP